MMEKTTIELDREKRHWANWSRGWLDNPWADGDDSRAVMDALIEWSKAHPDRRVYRHRYWAAEENVAKKPTIVETMQVKECPVHLCDLVHYLDIYHQ